MSQPPSRRNLLAGAAGGLTLGLGGALAGRTAWRYWQQPPATVGVFRVPSYGPDLARQLTEHLRAFPETVARARGGRVVLKPNMVEFHPDHPINTDARLVAAAVEAFRQVGAAEVVVAEGPGHHRDMELLLDATEMGARVREAGARFVDLNIDRTSERRLAVDVTGLGTLSLPVTALDCDLLVSVAKMKTHHWVGATLTLKNLFGTVPGAVYGWPKNVLHWAGIDRSIIDIWQALTPGFGIIDGVVAMEGDGPLMGDAVQAGVVLMGAQLPALDATAARLMGLEPHRMSYLAATARLGGTIAEGRITQLGDAVTLAPFALRPGFEHLRR